MKSIISTKGRNPGHYAQNNVASHVPHSPHIKGGGVRHTSTKTGAAGGFIASRAKGHVKGNLQSV